MNYHQKTKQLVNNEIFKKLSQYVIMIEQDNKQFNLTGFSGQKLWTEGIYESLISLNDFIPNEPIKLLDIGSGAGFPSIPFKIVNNHIELTIYESMQKRVQFLQKVSQQLNLNCEIIKTRVEDIKTNELFDYITARAVAPLKTLIEITHHLGKIGAQYVFIKGPNYVTEIIAAKKIIKELKIVIKSKKFVINKKTIVIITYKKNAKTPKLYPRAWREIQKNKL